MTKEKAITIIESHKAHWQRLLREKICDEIEGRETIEGFDMAISALSENKGFDGMTNGEVIQALFPEVKVEIDGFLVRCVFIEHEFTTTEEWWNAPYQKGGEE